MLSPITYITALWEKFTHDTSPPAEAASNTDCAADKPDDTGAPPPPPPRQDDVQTLREEVVVGRDDNDWVSLWMWIENENVDGLAWAFEWVFGPC